MTARPVLSNAACIRAIEVVDRQLERHNQIGARATLANLQSAQKTLHVRSAITHIENSIAAYEREHPPSDKDSVRARIDCRQLAAWLNWAAPKRLGQGDKDLYPNPQVPQPTPSFWVYEGERGFFDFETHEHGDCFALYMLVTGCDFATALKALDAYSGGSLNPMPRRSAPAPLAAPQPTDRAGWVVHATQLANMCADRLWSGATDTELVLTYLRTVRGFTDDTIRTRNYGYSRGGANGCAAGITMPWYDADGVIHALRIRRRVGNLAQALSIAEDRLDNAVAPKYTSLPGSDQRSALYGVNTLIDGAMVVLTEGEFDAALFQQIADRDGYDLCVLTPGSTSAKISPADIERLKRAPTVLIAGDNDARGIEGQARWVAQLHGANLHRTAYTLGKDATDYFTQGGSLADLLGASTPIEPMRPSLPDETRAAYNQYADPRCAPFMELYIEGQRRGVLFEGQGITTTQMIKASSQVGRFLNASTIFTGLNACVQLGIIDVLPDLIYPDTRTSLGRRAKRFVLKPLADIQAAVLGLAEHRLIEKHFPHAKRPIAPFSPALIYALIGHDEPLPDGYDGYISAGEHTKALNAARAEYRALKQKLTNLHSTPLSADWLYRNSIEYRALFTHATCAPADGQQVTKAELAAKIGISKRSVNATLVRAAMKGDPVIRTVKETGKTVKLEPAYNPATREYRTAIQIDGVDYSPQAIDGLAISDEASVIVEWRGANRLRVLSDDQPVARRYARPPEAQRAPRARHDLPPTDYRGLGHDPHFAQVNALKLVERATAWRKHDERLQHADTGEILDYNSTCLWAIICGKIETMIQAKPQLNADSRVTPLETFRFCEGEWVEKRDGYHRNMVATKGCGAAHNNPSLYCGQCDPIVGLRYEHIDLRDYSMEKKPK